MIERIEKTVEETKYRTEHIPYKQTVTKVKYKTSDGWMFDTQQAAEEHETEQLELKPCMRCGSKTVYVNEEDHLNSASEYNVICDDCGVRTSYYRSSSRAEAIQDWNNRPLEVKDDKDNS